jgi:putative ABC transport system permease protein
MSLVADPSMDAGLRRHQAVTVIGIARDEISRWIGNGEDKTLVYLPSNTHAAGNQILMGVHGDAEAVKRKLEADITAIDPDAIQRMQKIQVREWVAEDSYYTFRLAYWLSSAIGILALLLTLSGIYGVLSYVISQRTREIGIRMAFGAQVGQVIRLVIWQGMKLVLLGLAVSALIGYALKHLLEKQYFAADSWQRQMAQQLYGVKLSDPLTLFMIAALLTLVALLSCWLPARRAAKVDPLVALRYE